MARSLIHVVERDDEIRGVMEEHLSAGGYRVTGSAGFPATDESIAKWSEIDLVVISLLPEDDPRAFLEAAEASRSVIFLSERTSRFAETSAIVDLIHAGASDFLVKPVSGTALLGAVHRALRVRGLEGRVKRLENRVTRLSGHSILIGESSELASLQTTIEKAAANAAPVLITGETGVGKELAAREIHRLTERAGEFVAINCSSLGEELFESELFGYEPGAFTGARQRKAGLFEHADEGTLFLDEIGELAPAVQARLLRFLDDRKFRRLGGLREIEVDVKIIAATHRELAPKDEANRFRSDLYFRLSVLPIRIPPLRERGNDILLLMNHFLELAAEDYGRERTPVLGEAVNKLLLGYRWPGNIRELRNLAERLAANYPDSDVISTDEIFELEPRMLVSTSEKRPSNSPTTDYHYARALCLAEFDELRLGRMLIDSNGNISAVARLLGLDRKTLTTRLGALKALRERNPGSQEE